MFAPSIKNAVTVWIYNALSWLWKKAMPLVLWRLQNTDTCISYTLWVSICMTWPSGGTAAVAVFLLRLWAIKMNDDDGFQSAGRAESCFAAQSWSRQGQIVLAWCSRSHTVLWSSQVKHSHSSEEFRQRRCLLPSSPQLPTPAHNSGQSMLLTTARGKVLKRQKFGWEVEGDSILGNKLIRELGTDLGNRI